MQKIRKVIAMLLVNGCLAMSTQADWKKDLAEKLPLLGHRNWVVVADSAYPLQTASGIETIYVGGDHVDTVSDVLKLLSGQKHVRPVIFIDSELENVSQKYAPGIDLLRTDLNALLEGHNVHTLAHEAIIEQLDKAGETFRIFLIKTDLILPYTSVFIRLDCGYWSAEAESALRSSIKESLK